MQTVFEFQDFTKLASFFYRTVGIQPFDRAGASSHTRLNNLIFYASLINLNLNLLGEVIYVVLAFSSNNFVDGIMVMSYIGFVLVGDMKMLCIWREKRRLNEFMQQMQQLFPRTAAEQQRFVLPRYLELCRRITRGFSLLYMLLIWTYNLFAVTQYWIYERWLQVRSVGQNLPYLVYMPWELSDSWTYYAIYAGQCVAGYTSAAGQIASDLLLCAMATQLIMHYDHVSRSIEHYEAGNSRRDRKFLRHIISYHDRILRLSDAMNNVFGVAILFNFIASCFVICFVGFQMTIGVATDTLIKLCLFLFCSMAQVYLICFFGQQLIDASENVALAIYKHDWHKADVHYSRMLVLAICRSQKAAVLKATHLLSISRCTMTQILQISYKFFALIRTMYAA